MTNVKTLSAVIILATAIAAPAFAKNHGSAHDRYRGAYNQMSAPSVVAPAAGRDFEGGRDPSRVGGFDPSFNPSGS
jgi:hypothetical protein